MEAVAQQWRELRASFFALSQKHTGLRHMLVWASQEANAHFAKCRPQNYSGEPVYFLPHCGPNPMHWRREQPIIHWGIFYSPTGFWHSHYFYGVPDGWDEFCQFATVGVRLAIKGNPVIPSTLHSHLEATLSKREI